MRTFWYFMTCISCFKSWIESFLTFLHLSNSLACLFVVLSNTQGLNPGPPKGKPSGMRCQLTVLTDVGLAGLIVTWLHWELLSLLFSWTLGCVKVSWEFVYSLYWYPFIFATFNHPHFSVWRAYSIRILVFQSIRRVLFRLFWLGFL